LRGGLSCGKRFSSPDLPPMWRQPEPVPLSSVLTEVVSNPFRARPWPIADYRQTGSVTDDGAHIYQLDGHE
jgi:hypothetical protein